MFFDYHEARALSSASRPPRYFVNHSGCFIFPDGIFSCMQIRCGATATRKPDNGVHDRNVRPHRGQNRDVKFP